MNTPSPDTIPPATAASGRTHSDTENRPRARRRKGVIRREQIMDTAEKIFAERGYFGTSLRDVCSGANASLGVITHHFPTKETLLLEVVLRRRDSLARTIEASLTAAQEKSPVDHHTIESFIRPFLRSCVDAGSEFHTYIRLTSGFMSSYGLPEVRSALVELLPVSTIFAEYLQRAVPDMPDGKLKLAVYLIEAALIFMVQDQGFLDQVTENELPTEAINELIGPAAAFFTGGLRALAQGL